MKTLRKILDGIGNSLAFRVVAVVAITVAVSAWLAMRHAEEVHLRSAFEHTQKQVLVFLYGIERDVYRHLTLSPAVVQEILDDAFGHRRVEMGFEFVSLRLIDRSDGIVAAAPSSLALPPSAPAHRRGARMAVEMTTPGPPGMRERTKEAPASPASASEYPWTTFAIPISDENGVVFTLEADIDLRETMRNVQAMDNEFRRALGLAVGGSAVVALLVISVFLYRGLLAPVRHLSRMAHRIASGDLSPRAMRLSGDELGRLARDLNEMADSIERLMQEEERAYLEAMQSLLKALEAKDAYTAGHSAKVTRYSVGLGRHIGLSERELTLLEKGALLHDLGKIAIPDAILNKAGSLDHQERAIMQRHPIYTAAIMAPLRRFREFSEIAAWHHERWDGNGYPDGLAGEAIPLLARIVAIADSWDAMTGDRIYRRGMAPQKALDVLKSECDGGQWDPELVKSFIAMISGDMTGLAGDEPDYRHMVTQSVTIIPGCVELVKHLRGQLLPTAIRSFPDGGP